MPNASEKGDKAAGVTPLPLNCAICGEVVALSFTLRVPGRVPKTVGVKVTEILQLALAGRVLGVIGQFEVLAKSPVIEILVIVSGVERLLLRTIVCEVLVVCTTQFPKSRLVGLRV